MGAFKGFFLAVLAALLWGVSGTFGQFLFQQRGINIEWMITVRMLVSGICLLLFARFGEKLDLFEIWKNKKDAIQLAVFSITGMLAVQYTYFAAIKYSNAATATVLQYAGPVVIAIYLACKNKKVPILLELLAIILAVLGTFLLVTHGDIDQLSISGTALFFGLASAVALAIYTLQPVRLLSKYKSSVVIGWGMFCGGFAFSFVKAPWDVEGVWDIQTYWYTAFIVIFGTLTAFYAYLTAVQIIGGQKTSLLASAEPLSATILAVLWLHVSFSTIDWLGSLLIVSTVFLLSRASKKVIKTEPE
ncbi:transporter [Chryseobacterium piperi]|uniref:Transporter n=1 Tax=Chryseobacterium piperi TaxID=558152 RepID=A0A086AWN4_9FLAO|nr:EamA family transporter [Chryseobacterium piperi]ASW73460.1 EamA family transporter [Chryseobacterium piperi]KFF21098.1 transporter [Chryseobacterium piperi]